MTETYRRFAGLGEAELTAPAQESIYAEAGALVLNVTLTANQELLDNSVFVWADSDFELVSLIGTQTGNYDIKLRLPRGKYLPDQYCKHTALVGANPFPLPIEPTLIYPSGSKISFDLKDTSAAGNTVQIILKGRRIFRVRQ